jgi:hypothetical protein
MVENVTQCRHPGKYLIISIKIIYRKGGNKNKTPKINQRENYMKCRIQNNTNWEDFQKCSLSQKCL